MTGIRFNIKKLKAGQAVPSTDRAGASKAWSRVVCRIDVQSQHRLDVGIALRLATDVVDDAAEPAAQEAKLPVMSLALSRRGHSVPPTLGRFVMRRKDAAATCSACWPGD